MIKKLKRVYAQWLFEKYGFDRGPLFEKIPTKYLLNPLWSPSEYGRCESEQMAKWIIEGIEEGVKNPIKINLDKLFMEEQNL